MILQNICEGKMHEEEYMNEIIKILALNDTKLKLKN